MPSLALGERLSVTRQALSVLAMISTVLIIDADVSSRRHSVQVLESLGCTSKTAGSGVTAIGQLREGGVEVVIVDVALLGSASDDLLGALRRGFPGLPVVLMVDDAMVASPQVLRLGGHHLLTKPLEAREIKQVLERLAEKEGQRQADPSHEHGESPREIPGLIGTSERMRKVHRLTCKVALKRHPVLILGESGTGKELVARAIHQFGPWNEQPFVPVDCGALTPTLIESELFGHVRGAFTGAQQPRTGLLVGAGAGTVFLDEIGELPIELQSKMLRALQEKEVKPLGSNERVRFEARIIAATNQDLDAAVKRGTFRKDLFFRLNVVAIKLPPLRERKGDIPALVQYFISRYADRNGPSEVSDEVMGRLMSYDWPGNVRELENCIQRAVALGSGPAIQMQDLPSNMLFRLSGGASSQQELSTLQALERRAIQQALEVTGGDRIRAAKLLGIGKTTIYRKLKEYGLDDLSVSSSSA